MKETFQFLGIMYFRDYDSDLHMGWTRVEYERTWNGRTSVNHVYLKGGPDKVYDNLKKLCDGWESRNAGYTYKPIIGKGKPMQYVPGRCYWMTEQKYASVPIGTRMAVCGSGSQPQFNQSEGSYKKDPWTKSPDGRLYNPCWVVILETDWMEPKAKTVSYQFGVKHGRHEIPDNDRPCLVITVANCQHIARYTGEAWTDGNGNRILMEKINEWTDTFHS